ncbi:pseudouridine synthase [Anaerobiospirillum thomasii]|uniref:Pseudouridine synthase n=1 Tax=Anaerobiospirillum thomasii TaxID=179995 RepID=A0A2X0WUJ6_9GAMM|nr:RNA pseudouridine synthase [Anaerobiospirillum thomasii]SPT70162.1 Ribosomal small subunit pseudouridine synthase A [Anaerobiospirillum thomasii]
MDKKKKARLDKCVAHVFDVTRNQAFSLIKNGRVSVDDKIICDPAFKISLEQKLCLDDEYEAEVAEGFATRVFMLNKPSDYVCADRDKRHLVAVSLFNAEPRYESLHCAGRLDIDTTGLLIVSDDGNLIHEITSPKKDIPKVYLAVTDDDIPLSAIKAFASGLKHKEESRRYKSAILEILEPRLGRVTVTEGRFHEVKRLFECVGLNVLELKRVAIGALSLDEDLQEGEYRALSAEEIEKLFA